MARVDLLPDVFSDFDRFLVHMVKFGVSDAPARISGIVEALQILSHSPLIGRPVKGGKRELLIGEDSRGYVALYRFVRSIDTVQIIAVRSQREQRFRRRR